MHCLSSNDSHNTIIIDLVNLLDVGECFSDRIFIVYYRPTREIPKIMFRDKILNIEVESNSGTLIILGKIINSQTINPNAVVSFSGPQNGEKLEETKQLAAERVFQIAVNGSVNFETHFEPWRYFSGGVKEDKFK